jgi:hypothetical protein
VIWMGTFLADLLGDVLIVLKIEVSVLLEKLGVQSDCEGLELLGEMDHQLGRNFSGRGEGHQVFLLLRQTLQLTVVAHFVFANTFKCFVDFLLQELLLFSFYDDALVTDT